MLSQDIIVESVPIIGIFNKVINSNLEVVPQIQFYTLYEFDEELIAGIEEFDDPGETNGNADMNLLYELVAVRAERLCSLSGTIDEEDFYTGMAIQNHLTKEGCRKKLEANIRWGSLKRIVVAGLDQNTTGYISKLLAPKKVI